LTNLTIIDNNALQEGGGILCSGSNLILKNLKIISNGSQDGGGILCGGSNIYIENSIISDNNGNSGISLVNSSAVFKNVLITNNQCFGIECGNSNLQMINVTLVGNSDLDDWGGGIISYNSNLTLKNTISWNNSPTEIFFGEDWNNNDTIFISYSDIQGGEEGIIINDSTTVNWLEGNIDADPMFIGSGNNPFALSGNSPCIDTGTPDTTGLFLPPFDILGDLRIWNNRIDMGAYEWNNIGIEEPVRKDPASESEIRCYPNPFSTSTTIEYELKQPEKVTLSIYNHLGQLFYQIEENQSQGKQKLIWNAEGYADGIYYYRLQVGDAVANGKMVKVK